jgi:hypothetical protein
MKFVSIVAWMFDDPGSETPLDLDGLKEAYDRLYWVWPEETAGKPWEPFWSYPLAVELAWDALRDLADRLGVDRPPEPAQAEDDRTCRRALDQVIDWCWKQENKGQGGQAAPCEPPAQGGVVTTGGQAPAIPSQTQPGQGQGADDAGPQRRTKADAAPLRSWTQDDLDAAIRKYKADRAGSYYGLREAVREGRGGAREQAQKRFGRNAIAKALGVKARAMVSKSPAWQEMADELGLPRKGRKKRPLDKNKRIGYGFAEEEKAEAMGEQTVDKVLRNETIAQIRQNMDPKDAEATLNSLESGGITDDGAREIVQLYIASKKDDRYRIHESP